MFNEITGPGIDIAEANEILSLMRDPKWQTFASYLDRISKTANKKLRKLNNGLEENGYWKGVIKITEDITINIPQGLVEQIETAHKTTQNQHQPGRDKMSEYTELV